MRRFLEFMALSAASLVVSSAAFAGDHQRNLAGKLTSFKKPEVRVLTDHERSIARDNTLALDLDVNPDEIVCRKLKAGRDSASRLVVNRCKSRAEFRAEFEQRVSESDAMFFNSKYLEEVRRQVRGLKRLRNSRPARPTQGK